MRKAKRAVSFQEDPGNELFRKRCRKQERLLRPYIKYKVGQRVKITGVENHGTKGRVIDVSIFDGAIYYEVDNGILPDQNYHDGQIKQLLRGDEIEPCRAR